MSCISQVGFQWGVVRYHGFFAVSFLVNGVSTTLQKLIGDGGGRVVRGLVIGTIMISSLATSCKNGSESLIGMVE